MTQTLSGNLMDAQPVDAQRSAALLEQAVRVGSRDSAAAYLLAMSLKHLGRNADALAALNRVAEQDANVLLQRGILAYAEKDFAQAEQDFARSFEMQPDSYPAGYNLLLAQLCQKKKDNGAPLIDRLLPLTPNSAERRFLELLRVLLLSNSAPTGGLTPELQNTLATISTDDETRLVDMLAGLGQFEIMLPLLKMLVQLRPQSMFLWTTYCQTTLVQGKDLVDRCRWHEAQVLLEPLTRLQTRPDGAPVDSSWRLALFNMLGVCSCMTQEFERGLGFFRSAMELFQRDAKSLGKQTNTHGVSQEAWLEQNLALAFEYMGNLDKAETHWNRYFDHLEFNLPRSHPTDYLANLAFEGLNRLSEVYTQRERWNAALGFLSRAHKFRPSDPDVLERLFHLYDQLRKPDEARKILQRLREVRPNDAQVELFELTTRDVRDVNDLAVVLADLRRIEQKFPGNAQVTERILTTVGNLMPFMEKLLDQWTSQINKVLDQMRRLPSYQINWPMVREVMHDLEDKFFHLRKSAGKAQNLVQGSLRRDLQRLITQCDRKMEQCHSLGE